MGSPVRAVVEIVGVVQMTGYWDIAVAAWVVRKAKAVEEIAAGFVAPGMADLVGDTVADIDLREERHTAQEVGRNQAKQLVVATTNISVGIWMFREQLTYAPEFGSMHGL